MYRITSIITRTIDLDQGVGKPEALRQHLVYANAQAHTFRLVCTRGGEPVSLDGMGCMAYVRRKDGVTIPVDGITEGSTASVTLTAPCYAVPGGALISVELIDGERRATHALWVAEVECPVTEDIGGDAAVSISETLERLDAADAQIDACEAATDAATAAVDTLDSMANQFGMLGGYYTITVGETTVTIDASGQLMRVLAGNKWTPVTADKYEFAQPVGYNHAVIVFDDETGEFAISPASTYTGGKNAHQTAVGVVYWDADGNITKYHINGEVTDTAANQFGMLGGSYTVTVSSTEVVIDARGGIMRVLAGNKWTPVKAARYVLTKPENINHGVIYFEDGCFSISSASAYVAGKTEEKTAVGVVYWDMEGKITQYEINGKVNDQRSPNYGGEVIRDVHQWGAMGDGVTDDTDAIQAALDECKNGILYFPNGNYMITRTLYIHSNTHIMGNKGYTAIKLLPQEANELDELEWRPEDGRNKFPAVSTDDDSTGCIIEGIVFEGDSTYFHDLQQNGLYITGSHHVIQDCQFINWNYFPDKWEGRKENASAWGLAICHATHIKVEDCYFNKNGYEGAGTEFSYQVDFRGCYFGAAMRTGLQIHRASARISLEGCVLNNNVDSDNPLGDYATMTFHGAEGALIDGVKIVNCDFRHRHIQCVMGYERNVQISNCRLYSDSGYFVVITMGATGDIPQNEGWQIVGNEFFSLADGGITTIHMNVDASMVACNIIHSNANTPVVLNGSNNLAEHNLIVPVSEQ